MEIFNHNYIFSILNITGMIYDLFFQ